MYSTPADFAREYHLHRHIASTRDHDNKKYYCKVVGCVRRKGFVEKQYLKRHYESLHPGLDIPDM